MENLKSNHSYLFPNLYIFFEEVYSRFPVPPCQQYIRHLSPFGICQEIRNEKLKELCLLKIMNKEVSAQLKDLGYEYKELQDNWWYTLHDRTLQCYEYFNPQLGYSKEVLISSLNGLRETTPTIWKWDTPIEELHLRALMENPFYCSKMTPIQAILDETRYNLLERPQIVKDRCYREQL